MRARLVLLGIAVLLGALAWLLVRARESGSGVDAALAGGLAPGAQGAPVDAEAGSSARAAAGARQPTAQELRFEALPEEPNELVVHLVEEETGKPVAGAEVFVLEVDEYDWREKNGPDGAPVPDLEAVLRARGTRMAPDEHGDLHLPPPGKWLEICARKDDRFGATRVNFESLPEAGLVLLRAGSCLVSARQASGRPAADVEVVLGGKFGPFWRARTDAAGELRVPNLRWLIAGENSYADDWFVALNVPSEERTLRWFSKNGPYPERIDLVLGEMQGMQLRLCVSDGTPVPVAGVLEVQAQSGGLRLDQHVFPHVPIVRGEARLAHVQPGTWITVQAYLAGSQEFESEVRVPAPGGDAVALRIPEKLQVLLARATDEAGTPLMSRELEWVSFVTEEHQDREDDQHLDHVRTDEQGRLALVIDRRDLDREPEEEDATPRPRLEGQGILRAHGERELASAPIRLSSLAPGTLRDLGDVVLTPARPLVRGHVRDEKGRPLAHVRVGLEQARNDAGEHSFESLAGVENTEATRTDATGAFVLHGTCPGGTMHLNLERGGYQPPRDVQQGEFECGASPDLALTLVRDGALRTSVRAKRGFAPDLIWVLDDGRPESVQQQLARDPVDGVIVTEFDGLLPGTYKARLMDLEGNTRTFVAVEDVVVRPGLLTLDPRLLDLEIAAEPRGADKAREGSSSNAGIVIQVRDGSGNPIPDGLFAIADGDTSVSEEWHAGRVVLEQGQETSRLVLWSPGFRVWSGPFPNSPGEVRLEPAWRMRFSVEIPPELRRADVSLRLLPRILASSWYTYAIASRLAAVVLDAQGRGSFECPGECELDIELQAWLLEPGGAAVRADTEALVLTSFSFQALPQLDSVGVDVTSEKWAELAKALREAR